MLNLDENGKLIPHVTYGVSEKDLQNLRNQSYKEKWKLFDCHKEDGQQQEEVDIFRIGDATDYLEEGELQKAVMCIKEYFSNSSLSIPADADLYIRIWERYPWLVKFSFDKFFEIDNIWSYFDYHATEPYVGMEKLAYLYIDYSRYCYCYNKEKVLEEMDDILVGEFVNEYVYLWYLLEYFLDESSVEMQDYLHEIRTHRYRVTKETFINEFNVPQERKGYRANISIDDNCNGASLKSVAVALIESINKQNINRIQEMLNAILSYMNMSAYPMHLSIK